MSRNYHAEIIEATMAGDLQKVAALAHELAGRAMEAERLEEVERTRKANHAEWKRNRRQRPQTSTDVHGHPQTAVDVTDMGSPLVPPSPLPEPNSPPPFNPPSRSPRSAARGEKRPSTTGPRKASWLEPSCTSWEAKFGAGSFPWGEAGKALKPLHDAGHTPDEIATRLARYLAKTETRYASLHRFAKTYDDWKEFRFLEGPPVVDGWMSPELERLTRPPGVYAA